MNLWTSHLTAVVFDCDGVLVDSEPLHYRAFQQVLAPLGLEHDYECYMNRYIGFDDREAFVEVFRDAGRSIENGTLSDLIQAKNEVLLRIISEGVASFPGVVPLVRELSVRRVPLAVASGALRREVESFVEALGLKDSFQVIVGADDVARSKPDPETYLVALGRLRQKMPLQGLPAHTCVAIEDTPAGIQAAKGAGLFVIGVAHSFPPDQLQEADYVLEDLEHLTVEKLVELIRTPES